MTHRFDFVLDARLRDRLSDDYRELLSCIDIGAYKAANVLAGSIAEAILLDRLKATSRVDSIDFPRKPTLPNLVEACRTNGVISDQARYLSQALKSYRRQIHPDPSIRTEELVDSNDAAVARALVDVLIRDFEIESRRTPRAEATVEKVIHDPASVTFDESLLDELSTSEVERLLVEVIPEVYFPAADDEDLLALSRIFRSALRRADEDLRQRVAEETVRTIRSRSGKWIARYLETLFRCEDLGFLRDEDTEFVISYLLGMVRHHPHTVAKLGDLTPWLDLAGARRLVREAVRSAPDDDNDAGPTIMPWLLRQILRMPVDLRSTVMLELDNLAKSETVAHRESSYAASVHTATLTALAAQPS